MIAEPSESIDMEKQSKTTTTENKKLIKRLHLRNMIALIFGVIGGFGIISVGNFRDTENLTLHNTSVIIMVAAFSVLMIENVCFLIVFFLKKLLKFSIIFFITDNYSLLFKSKISY